ncbi:hypothetical protein V8G54_016634 [Vigna mungo]|uniref:Uncharacterized protein n=1 Tax=Vigna mungo TaxID=3915 RepID=A0AAQ3NKJ8_VIGMU
MKKLRKHYHTEIQRLCSLPLSRLINNSTAASPSSWVHFKSMDSMEKGPNKPHTTTTTNPNIPPTTSISLTTTITRMVSDPDPEVLDLTEDDLIEKFVVGVSITTSLSLSTRMFYLLMLR